MKKYSSDYASFFSQVILVTFQEMVLTLWEMKKSSMNGVEIIRDVDDILKNGANILKEEQIFKGWCCLFK